MTLAGMIGKGCGYTLNHKQYNVFFMCPTHFKGPKRTLCGYNAAPSEFIDKAADLSERVIFNFKQNILNYRKVF